MAETKRPVDKNDWPMVVGAQIQLFHRDGTKIGGANGSGVIEGLDEPTEKYPGGVVHYRVLRKISKGAVPSNRVAVVKPDEKMVKDACRTSGVPPSKTRTATPKKKLKNT